MNPAGAAPRCHSLYRPFWNGSARTPARDPDWPRRCGISASTYGLRRDRVARDAVCASSSSTGDLGAGFVAGKGCSGPLARTKAEFLQRPELGRSIDPAALTRPFAARRHRASGGHRRWAGGRCGRAAGAHLLPLLDAGAVAAGGSASRSSSAMDALIVLSDIGEVLDPAVVVLLIGERWGWRRRAFPTWPIGESRSRRFGAPSQHPRARRLTRQAAFPDRLARRTDDRARDQRRHQDKGCQRPV